MARSPGSARGRQSAGQRRDRDAAPVRALRAVRAAQAFAHGRQHGARGHARATGHLSHRAGGPAPLRWPANGCVHRRRGSSARRVKPGRRAMKAPVLASFFAVALGGCTVGPEYRRPDAQLPASWTVPSTSVSNGTGSALALGEWWRSFDDPLLNRLIQEAVEANLELKIAAARVREARAARLATSSGYWPQVGAGADYSRARLSENGPLGRTLHDAGRPLENDLFTAGLDASWEIDVFGGTRRAVEAAGAEHDAAEEPRRDVLVILLAEVAGGYN